MQIAFDKMRLLMAANALAAYLDHNKQFDVYTDASDFQLGGTFLVRGSQAFRIAYIHTQNNTTFYVGIKHETTKIPIIRCPPKFSLWRKPNNNNSP